MRDRLIELIKDAEKAFPKDKPVLDIEEFVADHLLANGVIVPPCKVGDWVYMLRNGEIHRNHICQVHISQTYAQTFFSCYGEKFGVEQIGKTVFLTKEEAEKALERSAK